MRNTVVLFLTFLLTILFVSPLAAQNCGCVEEENCPETIAPVSNFNVCYTFTDAFNGDLADPAQGVCGVNLAFTHDYIWDLEMTLISPNGTEVMLVGEDTMGTGGTTFTSWDVQFVGCGDVAVPDGTLEPVWTNNQNWPFIGAIGGSYYPVAGGCLENFNSGPVNGEWCIEVNSASFTGGTLLDFEVLLCDQSGIFCCDANGGDLDDELVTCEGDASLVLDLEVEYTNLAPDVTSYGYTFLIGEVGGLLLEVSENPDMTGYVAGTYEVCGLSYDLAEDALVPIADGILTMQDIKDDLNGLNPSFCASLSDDCYPVTIGAPPLPMALLDTICIGQDYDIGDSTFSEAGDYDVIFNSFFDCDSLVNLTLVVLPIDTAYITETICLGDSLVVSDSVFYATGNYEVYLDDASRCDSTYLVDLTVIEPVVENVVATICEGGTYEVGLISYNTTGMYSDTILSIVTGCDSIVNLDLEVITVNAEVAPPESLTCENPVITLDGTLSSDEAGTIYEWTEFAGGNILPPNDQATVQVSDNGLYKFKVTRFGCSDSVFVNVLQLDGIPTADAGATDSLTCSIIDIQLDGTASEMGTDIVYSWFTDDGSITENENTLTPTINFAPATYSLSVLDTVTGCADTSSVFISLSNETPMVDAGDNLELTCTETTVLLDGNSSYIGDDFTYVWTDSDGILLPPSPSADAQATTSAIGVYTFTITNIETGCFASDSTEVISNINLPIIDAGITDSLTCENPEIQLLGTINNSINFTILWTGGNITSGNNTLTPTVNEAGLYFFTVTDNGSNCPVTDSVLIEQIIGLPDADAGPDTVTLSCILESWQLGDTDNTSIGDEFLQEWYLNDALVSTDFPHEINEVGTYTLLVTNDLTGCERSDTIEILENIVLPTVDAGDDLELTCTETTVVLDGSDSYIGDDFTYVWTDSEGIVLPSADTQATTSSIGVYTFTITNIETGCFASDSTEVISNINLPIIDAGITDSLTCENPEIQLLGTINNSIDFTILWTGGNITSGNNTLTPTINQPSWYFFTVTDNGSNCPVTDSVLIEQIVGLPDADAGPDTVILNCTLEVWQLGDIDNTSIGDDFLQEWYLNDALVSTDFPYEINETGTYTLLVTNNLTGCERSDTIEILEEVLLPIVDAGDDLELTCTETTVLLDGSGSYVGDDFTYIWTNSEGVVLPSTDAQAIVNALDTYTFTITNIETTCSASDTTEVRSNVNLPIIDAGITDTLTCANTEIQLLGTIDNSTDFTILWTGDNDILDENTLTPTINEPGLYYFTVTDNGSNCPVIDSVLIEEIVVLPDADAGPTTFILNCTLESRLLGDIEDTTLGDDYSQEWYLNNALVSTDFPYEVSEAGIYILTVRNDLTGCERNDTIEIIKNLLQPIAYAGEDFELNCETASIILDGEETSELPDEEGLVINYAWYDEDDNLIQYGEDSLLVVNPGMYYLIISDTVTFCADTAYVNITQDASVPLANAGINAFLDCATGEVTLDGTGSSEGDYTYTWTGPTEANITNGMTLMPTVNSVGTYILEVSSNTDNCVDLDEVEVAIDTLSCQPEIILTPGFETFANGINGIVDCLTDDQEFIDGVGYFLDTLDASGTVSPGGNISYDWTALSGFIVDEDDPQFPVVTEGEFVLTVTNTLLNLSVADTISVINIRNFPNADAGPSDAITCANFQNGYTLDGSLSDQGGEFSYLWTTDFGNFGSSDITSLTPTVFEAGTYELFIINNTNGCEANAAVLLSLDGQIPTPCFKNEIQMECANPTIMIGDTCTINPDYSYTWTVIEGGTIIGANDEAVIEVQTDTSLVSGFFEVIVVDNFNSCTFTDTVEVFTAVNCYPDCVVNAQTDIITCIDTFVILDGTGSSVGDEYAYLWEVIGGAGSLCGDEETLMPCVDEAGFYRLTVTNIQTGFGCQSSLVFVNTDDTSPDVEIDDSDNPSFTCIADLLTLSATSDDTDAYTFNWSSTEDCILTDTNAPQIEINCEATYSLTVTDINTGCENISEIVISYDTLPPALVVVNPSTASIGCNNPQAVLSGSGSSQGFYSWYRDDVLIPGAVNLSYVANIAGEYCLVVTDINNGCTASSCATVEADVDAVFADAGENQFLTCSANFVSLTGDAPTGPEFSYQWSTDAGANCFSPATGSLNITASCPGTYILTVTDFTNGCTGASLVEVIDMTAAPITDAGPDMELDCNITQATLDGSASEENLDFIYNWVGADGQGSPMPSGSLTPTVTAPGLYTLLIFNSNTNCFDVDSVFVTQDVDLPEVIAGTDASLTCDDMQITLDGSTSEQNDSLSYIWNAEDGTGIISSVDELDIVVNEDGNYILTITNDTTNCTNRDTIFVSMDTLSPLPIIMAENEGMINCFLDTITLDAANSEPIGNLNYQWQTTSGNIITETNLAEISLNQGGNYNLNITNTENGCVNDTTISVQQDFSIPLINIAAPDMLTCVVQSVELNAVASQTNSLFEWTSADGFLITNPETATPTVFEPGEYILKLSSQDNGCEDEETILVPEDITPPTAVANVEGTLDCVTNSVMLNGEGSSADMNTSYLWEGIFPVEEETSLITTAFAAGDYSLIVINGDNGCQDTAMVEVIASGFPITELQTTSTNPTCADISGGFIQIDSVVGGNAPYYFSFDGSIFSEYDYRNYLSAGTYQIAVEDIDGCEYEISISLEENPSLLIDLGGDIEVEIGDSIELSVQINLPDEAIDTIIWRPLPNENCPGCSEQMITPSESMNVLVEVVDTFGCSATDNIFLYVVGGEESPIFVPSAFSPNSDGNNDELIVFGKSNVEEIELFQIFDRWGEMMFEAKDFLPENPDAAWDGMHHNQALNTQVFTWRMQYRLKSSGEVRVVWGDLTLLR